MTSVYYSSFEPSEDSGAKGTAAFASVTAASLTVPSSIVPTLANGTGGVYSSSGGFMVVKRSDEVLTAVYSVESINPSTPTWITIDAVTGQYTVTDPLADTASAVLRATVDGTDYDLTYSLAKVKRGVDGTVGSSNAIVYLYQRAATSPTSPTGTFTYTFATGVLSGGTPGSWTQAIPAANGNPLWVIAATASSATATDTITAAEFSSPVVLTQDGANGTNGLNSATVFLYQRAATAPAVPNASTTYTFATGILTGASIGSWTQTVPAGTDPLYVTTATAAATTATDSILTTEWAAVRVLAQNGTNGAAGTNSAIVYLYQRAVTTPSAPTGTFTYTFATGVLSGGTPGSWTQAIPATNGNPLWVIAATASANTATDTIAAAEFSAPVTLVSDGATGAAGLNSATVFLYQRATSAPTAPSTTTTYTFATGILTGTLGSWTQTVPVGTDPLYVTTATAAATTTTDTILTSEWATVRILAQNGANGLNNAIVYLYQRVSTTPTAPTGTFTYTFSTNALSGGTPGSWTQAIPATNGNPLWVIAATASSSTSTDTIAAAEFSSPVVLSQDGATGANGLNTATVFLYQRATSAPAVPSTTTTYTFATGILTGTLGSWTQTVPTGTDPLYVTTATAAATAATDTILTSEWATVRILAQNGATGPQGPALQITALNQAFTFRDNVADPTSQNITLTANLQGITDTVTWTVSPAVTLSTSGNSTTLSVANFGTNRQVTITATLGTLTDRITLVRLDRDVLLGNANRVPFSRIERGQGWGTSGAFAPTPFLITFDGRSFIVAEPTFTAANQDVFLFSSPRFAVAEGERLSVSGRIQAFALSGGANPSFWQYYIEFYSASSTILGNQPIGSGSTNISENVLHSAFATAPTGTRSAQVVLLYKSSAAGPARMAILEPMVTSALAGQTAHPPFTPGPNASDGATVGAPSGTNVAGQDAATLVADAATAKANAATSLSELALIASDAWLTQGEKPAVRIERDAILDEFPTIRDRADAFGVSRTTYATAYTDLIAYLAALNLDTASNIAIVAATFNTRFRNYYAARETVLDGIALVASQRANLITSNVVVDSEFYRGTYAYRFSLNTQAGPTLPVTGGVNLSASWSGIKNVMWATVNTSGANWDSAGYADPFTTRGQWIGGNITDQKAFGMPVKAGDRVYARCLLARHRCNTQLYVLVFDKDGNFLEAAAFTGGRVDGAGGGNPTNFDLVGGVHIVVNANAATAQLMWRMLSTSQPDPYIFMTEPAMGILPSWQTTLPAYQTGRTDPLADSTRTTLSSLNRGEWASGVAYALGDIVTRNGSSYTAIIAHTSDTGNQPLGTNWALLANAGAQGTTGVSAPPTKALGTGGAAQFDPIRLTAGQTLTVDAALFLNTGGTAGTCSMQVQWSINAANSWTTMTNGSASVSGVPTTEPVELYVPNATFTNTSGSTQLYDIRVTSTRQSRTVNQPLSYMRVV